MLTQYMSSVVASTVTILMIGYVPKPKSSVVPTRILPEHTSASACMVFRNLLVGVPRPQTTEPGKSGG
ncbi:MAG: hypothetical protein ABSD88_06305 [Candidatus Korobacteraceae bacterium]